MAGWIQAKTKVRKALASDPDWAVANVLLCLGSARSAGEVGNLCFGPAGMDCGHAFALEQPSEVGELELVPWEVAQFDGMGEGVLEESFVAAVGEGRT